MANVSGMLRQYANSLGIRLDIAEKDYALSYLLAAIAETPGLGDHLALKGGTALKKAYHANHRFSEDLDYSTLRAGPLPDISAKMELVVERMTSRLQQRGPFEVQHEPLLLKQTHPGEQVSFIVRVRFPGQRQALCRLKVEITVDEQILLPVEVRPLLHSFDEDLEALCNVYALSEILAEKLRALLQARHRLVQRGWGASRVCRDYYDLWAVLTHEGLVASAAFPDLVHAKCALRGITFTTPQDFLAADLQKVARSEWEQQLLPFVPQAPPVEQVLADLQLHIPALFR